MIVFLHGNNPRNIIECHRAESKVGVIGDFGDFLDKGIEVGCWDAVYSCDEVCGREAVLV